MPIYQVTPLARNLAALKQAVEATQPPMDWKELQGGAGLLIHFSGTTVELSNLLGITGTKTSGKSPVGLAILVSVGSYYGLGSTEMWEWLKTRIEQQK